MSLAICGPLLARLGEPEQAVQLLALAFTHPQNIVAWMERWPLLTRLRADLEMKLGTAAYQTAWAHGAERDINQVVIELAHRFGRYQPAHSVPAGVSLVEQLTPRELEVLRLVAQGYSNREIAEMLVLSIGTVKGYVYNVCQKLGVQNRTHAVARARRLNLI